MWLLVLALGVAFWGCAKKPVSLPPEGSATQPTAQAETESRAPETGQEASLRAPKQGLLKEEVLTPSSKSTKEERLSQEQKQLLYGRSTPPLKAIFFDFDDYTIRPDMRSRLEENARYLLAHPQVTVELQGNCDERGSTEYNLALGEKRALSVKKYLVNRGVSAQRLITVSFGEERPLDPRHTEEAWAKNRRVDLVIIK
ncbi:peptidoglycan-associated lipoprotein Pal [Thermosulfuriphilus ammonigenes]|uniref:Peptidoglycan-associated protein n=2 Tax=Thermosulfuriphilus ammonigenes TaxID=1936021 RepID=A0A6G7PZA2_9BACT|nr:peptidoglycan-associated lipoprotein Pal [Thermosulfuriphilus ammonigenes]